MLKKHKKFLCWDDEGEPILILQFGAIRQLNPKTVQVLCWNKGLHKLFSKLGKNRQALDGTFTNFWEDGEFTIRLYQYELSSNSLEFLVAVLGDKPGYLALGTEYLYTTLVSGKIKRSQGKPWKRQYVIFNLNELLGVNFTRKRNKKFRAINQNVVWRTYLRKQMIDGAKATAEQDLKINQELESTLTDGLN